VLEREEIMIRAVIFDLDNTLVDFMAMKKRAVEAAAWAMVDSGLPMTIEETVAGIYKTYDALGIEYQQVFDQFLTNELGYIDYKILAAGVVAYRKAREAALQPYPHVKMTITELIRRGLKLAVLSDAPRREAWLRLCQLGLHHEFDVVVTYEDTGFRKPAREPFERVLHDLNVQPHEAIMLGDWPERDVAGAKSVGLWTVWAKYGSTFNVEQTDADFEAESVRDLHRIIDGINAQEELSRTR
jgi:putative hydrolase of the HAD superfamily